MWRMSPEPGQQGEFERSVSKRIINAYPVLVPVRCDWTVGIAPGTGPCIGSALTSTIAPISPLAERPETVETCCIGEFDDGQHHLDPLQPSKS